VKIVVDTNIIFSAIIHDKGKIGELLLNKPNDVQFLAPDFLLEELTNHTQKLLSLTGYSEDEYQQIKSFVTKPIEFIKSDEISKEYWETSFQILKDIDEKDTSFLALTMQVGGFLWTGDKKLIKGLKNKNYNNIVATDMLYTKYFGS